jgi:hypothetical protein
MKSKVVITSIYPPAKAVEEIAKQGKDLIVVGDKKTPSDWAHDGVQFLSVDDQAKLPYKLLSVLPFNHYGRKMLGYLEAMKQGAEVIIDTDDDNIPKANWSFPDFDGDFKTTAQDAGFVNIYSYYTTMKIWPRGIPLDRIHTTVEAKETAPARVGVWQGLADGDPDVDAIYRLVSNELCNFDAKGPIVLGRGTLSPTNTQNTATRRELFPLLYLPAYVTFRFTDILRGWIAQPIMWAAGYSLGFIDATVVQERNPHDYTKDFESEIPCYLHGNKIIEAVQNVVDGKLAVSENLKRAYTKLHEMAIVTDDELTLLDAWLTDVAALTSGAGESYGN